MTMIEKTEKGFVVDDKVLIDWDGVLWNVMWNEKPFKDFPQEYFNIRDGLEANKLVGCDRV